MLLHAPDEVRKGRRFLALRVHKNVVTIRTNDRVVNVHRAARLILDRLGHKCGIAIVAQSGLSDHAFEIEYFIRQFHRITVAQVHLDLTRAALLQDAVDLEAHRFGEIINIVDNGTVFIHRRHGIGLSRRRRPPRAPQGRHHGLARVRVARHKVEFHLWGHDGLPPAGAVQRDDTRQHVARSDGHRRAVRIDHVVYDLKGPIRRPRCRAGSL